MSTRSRSLRRHLSVTLVGVALVSVLLLSAVIYVFARVLINDGVRTQIESVRDTRIEAIDIGVSRLEAQVSGLAANPTVVGALIDLADEFGQLDETVGPDQVSGLADLYDREVLPPFVAVGADIDATGLVPASPAGRYVQQKYIAENPNSYDERDLLDDAGDGSGYSAAHAEHHPVLRALLENTGMSDLLLVDVDTGDVVYSTEKRIDVGTNGFDGPYSEDGLGQVLAKLTSAPVGDAVISDSFFYIPTRGRPVVFIAAAIRSRADVVGVVVTEVPVDALTAVMTAQGDWERLGLGRTGESYVVGADGTLRSDSRLWIEDPDEYLRRYVARYDDQDRADLIATVGSPVLLQEVDNEAVDTALDDEEFVGTVENYLGRRTLAASGPAGVDGVNWAVVVEVDRHETDSALNSLLRRMLWVLALLLPAIGLIGVLLARILTRPANTLVGAAAQIAAGDLDAEVPDLGRNELGDLGRQLEGVAHQLESRDQLIMDEERNINDMLTALLPARLIDRVRQGEDSIEDIFDTATVVSITVDGAPEGVGADQDLALEITDRLEDDLQALMDRYGVERIHRSAASQLYLTGLDQDDARVADAAEFTLAAMKAVADVGAEFGQPLTARSGMSTGDVATGVLGSSQLSFGVWGDPPDVAITLGSLARPGDALADHSVAEQLGADWDLDVVDGLVGLDDDTTAFVLNGRIESR